MDDGQLGRETEELVFRVAREAIRNVAEHAHAEHVTVRVEQRDGGVRLTVADDGAGFTPDQRERRRAEGHVGLSLVEELAEHAGGRVAVSSAPGGGTTVTLRGRAVIRLLIVDDHSVVRAGLEQLAATFPDVGG